MDRGRVEKSVDVMIVKLRQLKWEKGSTTETLCCYYTQFSDKKNYLKWKMVKVRKKKFFSKCQKVSRSTRRWRKWKRIAKESNGGGRAGPTSK